MTSSAEVCLSVDIDWAADEVIADSLALIEESGVRATWFVTHLSPLLRQIETTPGQALGLHPNFNNLLDGTEVGSARDVLLRLRECAPNAVSIRSHSLTRSSRLADLFVDQDLTHESNYIIPPTQGHTLRPWKDYHGLIQAPIRWEDDVRLLDSSLGEPVDFVGNIDVFILDFHPIHVFLNTTCLSDYESARRDFRDAPALRSRRRPLGSGGSRDRLIAVLDRIKALNLRNTLISDCRPQSRI